MRALRWLIALAVVAVAGGLYVTRPIPLSADALDGLTADAERGALVFAAAGCASCHMAPEGDPTILAGGKKFPSPFGTFVAPNISPDPDHGVGAWTDLELASAIQRGVGRRGEHLFPAFPYDSYVKAERQDVVDLIAHLRTLPADPTPSLPHEVGFPFNIRAAVGGWKLLYLSADWAAEAEGEAERGRYLAEALGHCGACHTPRNMIGGPDLSRWMGGAPHPGGEGRFPNITTGSLLWSEGEIAEYLKSGFTPDFDSAGGEMAEVIDNTSQMSDDDRAAIAAYLVALPPVSTPD